MADTVEQVYVWDGNDWTPVVRDETVSNTSELTNDGEDGVNPFITAADIPAVPDKKLPLDSADGTVVLDSPSADKFTISTGGETQVTIRPDGMIGVGYGGQVNIGMCLYQDFQTNPTNANTEWGFVAAPRFDSQPESRCVAIESQPLFTGVVADDVVHFKANDQRAGNERFDGTQYGLQVDNLLYSNTSNIGVCSRMFVLADRENYAFYAPGSAPSYFNGEIRTTKLVGIAHSTDASIEFGAELLTSNHTPTQPNSIATKQTVDDKIQVMTTAEYNALATKNPTTLYCLTD